jgi:DNA-binding CsgD family transcriptional regulator/pimeloyl-ACP methyl ester carboxylesterase
MRTMERTTQYATTRDGVRIAFSTKGRGMPYIELPTIPFCNGAGPAEIPQWQAWDAQVAERAMLVDYDCRGAGMSDRDVTDFSLDAWVRDLDAVVDALGEDRVTLFAPDSLAVPTAIAFAARWPKRVSHLVLWQAHTGIKHLLGDAGFAGVLELIDRDWALFCEVLVQVMEGWSDPDTAHRAAAMMRDLHTPHGVKAAMSAAADIDVSDLLPLVESPTLVLHRRAGRQPLSDSLRVASAIPNARLVSIDGTAFSWALEQPDAVLRAIDDFVCWSSPREPARPRAKLSPRELEVLRLLAEGKSSNDIARHLVLAVRTVERHISNIYRKIDARNRAQATAYAFEHRILDRP